MSRRARSMRALLLVRRASTPRRSQATSWAIQRSPLVLRLRRPGPPPPASARGRPRSFQGSSPRRGQARSRRCGPPGRRGSSGRGSRAAAHRGAGRAPPRASRRYRRRGGSWARRGAGGRDGSSSARAIATRLRVPPESSAIGRSHSLTPRRSRRRRASWAVSHPPRCSTRSERAASSVEHAVVRRARALRLQPGGECHVGVDGGPERLARHLELRGHRRPVGELRLLGQVGHRAASAQLDLAAIGLGGAGQQSHERGLPRAVHADEADALALLDRQGDAVEDGAASEGEAEAGGVEQRHGSPARRRPPGRGAAALPAASPCRPRPKVPHLRALSPRRAKVPPRPPAVSRLGRRYPERIDSTRWPTSIDRAFCCISPAYRSPSPRASPSICSKTWRSPSASMTLPPA